MASELKGTIAPKNAVFQNVVLHTAGGEPLPQQTGSASSNLIPDIELATLRIALCRNTRHRQASLSPCTHLIVRMAATIGNYDYFQDYIFQQDGRIRIRLISTRVDAVKGVLLQP